jgi:transposase-like protein
VFGIVARNGTKCAFHIVPDVKKATLLPLIQQHVHTSCEVYHDGLQSYAKLHDCGYVHRVVIHSEEFVTDEGVHTNTIEGLWGLLKQRVARMHGLNSVQRYAAHLDEFSFRQNFSVKGTIWVKLLQLCAAEP